MGAEDEEEAREEGAMSRREEALRLRLTSAFLDTLVEAARVVGNDVDFVEIQSFLGEVFVIAGRGWKEAQSTVPYASEGEEP